ncbi:MAG TPA: hypothetical protein VGL94_19330 [Ktedonobacteraceae bacterium]|jgi:hypothetical protein
MMFDKLRWQDRAPANDGRAEARAYHAIWPAEAGAGSCLKGAG